MDQETATLLTELAEAGRKHDVGETRRGHRLLNITPDTGRFLAVLIRAVRPASIIEIGTSNGYSTIWLADAARYHGGRVTTIEAAPHKVALASRNIARAGLCDVVRQIEGDAAAVVATMAAGSADFIFLDADRGRYGAMWPDLARVLGSAGLLVVDNACSHADEVAPLAGLIDADPTFESSLVPIGKGELIAVKGPAPAAR